MVKTSPSWPWLVAWTSPSTCARALSRRENMHLWMCMKAETVSMASGGSTDMGVPAYMAKWGVGDVSGARGFPVGIGKIGMAGVRTIKGDGLVRSRTPTNPCPAMLPARRRR